jgi:hypothetical protein
VEGAVVLLPPVEHLLLRPVGEQLQDAEELRLGAAAVEAAAEEVEIETSA